MVSSAALPAAPADAKITVNADTRLYGILGNPVHHSLSPLIHNTLFGRLKMNSVYLAFQIREDFLASAFEAVRSLGIQGVNITIPFKETAMDFIDEVPNDIDRCIGAVNTVVNRSGKLFGYNTDGPGFLTALQEELGFDPSGKRVLVLGAGGAARGVAFTLAHRHAAKVLVHNRTLQRAEGLCGHLRRFFPKTEIETLDSLDRLKEQKIDLVVNATSCGMGVPVGVAAGSDLRNAVPFDLRRLKKAAAVYDLVYSPSETPFLGEAKRLGFQNTNGLGMLAAQATLSFELWTGVKEGVREIMLGTLKKCSL